MIAHFEQFVKKFEGKTTKIYLIIANVVLVTLAISASNAGLLPFRNLGDFAFFLILGAVFAIYRPGWSFLFFIGSAALENINLAPVSLGIAMRPYQFFAAITLVSLIIGYFSKRLSFELPKWRWYDFAVIVFVFGGFLSALFSMDKGASFKQTIVALSFAVIYFLTRIYIQGYSDFKRVLPFFLSSSMVVMIYAFWQNIRFNLEMNSFEVMPGRPNATFTEPDWLGIYLVILLAIMFAVIFAMNKAKVSAKFQFLNYFLITVLFIVLIMTVSRSAWVGAAITAVAFWKAVGLNGSLNPGNWLWKEGLKQLVFTMFAAMFALAITYGFSLTTFQLGNRLQSTGSGLQKITIACDSDVQFGESISNVSELEARGCKHINLEEIENEKAQGKVVKEIFRTDPNVDIRKQIYSKSLGEIKTNPIIGIGWGGIGRILGTDERGAGLNASNIFLEVWLGSGIFGLLAILSLVCYILAASVKKYFTQNQERGVISLLATLAILIPNFFNAGIFLAMVWIILALNVSILEEK
jgi:uncharacterized membrane protein